MQSATSSLSNQNLPVKFNSEHPLNSRSGFVNVNADSGLSRSGDSLGPSFSSKEKSLRWQVQGRKCSCHSTWCPTCWGQYGKKGLIDRFKELDWRFVRHIVLTLNRGRGGDPGAAYDEVVYKRGIGNLIKNLERTDQVRIVDWISIIEWHEDGFPHWHIFIEVEDEGSKGRIGKHVIASRWPFGLYVYENYFESEQHWKYLIGYFDRNGYLEKGKGYQSRLPDWAKKRVKRIKRWISKKGIATMSSKAINKSRQCYTMDYGRPENYDQDDFQEQDYSLPNSCKTYEMKLSKCGKSMSLECSRGGEVMGTLKIKVPYQNIKKEFNWKYVMGKGLILNLTEDELSKFWDRVEEMEKEEIEKRSVESVNERSDPPLQEH